MEAVANSLIATGPIDSCRGRGRYKVEPNLLVYVLIKQKSPRKTIRKSTTIALNK